MLILYIVFRWGCCGRDHKVDELKYTIAISAYHHLSCEINSRQGVLETAL